MGRKPCCQKEELKKGAWTAIEDQLLTDYIKIHGEGKWRNISKISGLQRCGKSCRLRWLNYLRPGIKRGNISNDEEELIIRLHNLLGNRWSLIAGRLPGRTDNEIKNYWNTIIGKKIKNQKNQIRRSKSDPLPLSDEEDANIMTNYELQKGINTEPLVAEIISSDDKDIPSKNNIDDSSDVLLDFEIDQQLLSYLLNADSSELNMFEATNQCNYQLNTPNSNEISLMVSDDSTNLGVEGFPSGISPLVNENCDFDWL